MGEPCLGLGAPCMGLGAGVSCLAGWAGWVSPLTGAGFPSAPWRGTICPFTKHSIEEKIEWTHVFPRFHTRLHQPTTGKHCGSDERGNSDDGSGFHSCKRSESGCKVTEMSGVKWKGEKGVDNQLMFTIVLYPPIHFCPGEKLPTLLSRDVRNHPNSKLVVII